MTCGGCKTGYVGNGTFCLQGMTKLATVSSLQPETTCPGHAYKSTSCSACANLGQGTALSGTGADKCVTANQSPCCNLPVFRLDYNNTEATAYALAKGRVLLPTWPPFAALDFADRTDLATRMLRTGEPDQQIWVLLALFSALAFDTAAHLHTTEALAQRHPGLAWLRFPAPDPDGLWRFPHYSYGRPLAHEHPHTTAGGHPA